MSSTSSEVKALKNRIKELEEEIQKLRRKLEKAENINEADKIPQKLSPPALINKQTLWPQIYSLKDSATFRKETEIALQESEMRYRNLVEKLPAIFHMLSTGDIKKVLYISPQVKSVLGYDPEEFLQNPDFFSSILHPNDKEWMIKSAHGFELTQKEVVFEFRIIASDGRIVWFRDEMTVVSENCGAPAYIQGIMTDITVQKSVEEKLIESEELYRNLIELSPNIIGIHSEGRVVFLNSAGFKLLNAGKAEEVIGAALDKFVPVEYLNRIKERQEEFADKHRMESIELTVKGLDGREHYLESFAQCLYYHGKPAVHFIARDVTETKKIREALEASEMKYRSLFEKAVEGIFQIAPGGRIIAANPAMAAMLGFDSPEELISHISNIWKQVVVKPGKREKVLARLEEDGEINGYEIKVKKRSGEQIWLSSSLRIERDSNGRPVFYEGIVEDITERKRYEAKLKITQFSVDRASPAVFWVRPDSTFMYVNDKACSMLGYNRSELLKMSVWDIDPNYPPDKWEELFQTIKENKSHYIQSIVQIRNGTIIPTEIYFNYYHYSGNEFYVAYANDITQRKSAEDALRKSEQKYRALIEQASDGIFVTDCLGNIIDVNSSGCRMTGYSREELIFMNVADLIEKQSLSERPLQLELITENRTHLNERTVVRKDGEVINVEISSTCLENGNIQGIVRDISARKQYEEEILKSKEELRMLAAHLETVREEERISVAREVHDELGQSLTGLKLMTLSLKKRIAPENPELTGKIEEITEVISLTLKSVKSILTRLRPEVLDTLGLPSAIEWLSDEFSRNHEIKVDLKISVSRIHFGKNISTVIFRILQEALTNIYKHSAADQIKIKLYRKNSFLILMIKDNGKGFNYQQVNKFESFGLTGMQERAYIAGGSLNIKSSKGLGTVLTLKIPEERVHL